MRTLKLMLFYRPAETIACGAALILLLVLIATASAGTARLFI